MEFSAQITAAVRESFARLTAAVVHVLPVLATAVLVLVIFGRSVLVPNGDVFTSRITNNTASSMRRASVFASLEYKEDTERALALILDTVRSVPGVVGTPPPSMRLRELSPDGVQLEARFWADSRRTHLMNTASAARVAILRAVKSAGLQLPDPDQRVVTFATAPPGAPHSFTPAGRQAMRFAELEPSTIEHHRQENQT